MGWPVEWCPVPSAQCPVPRLPNLPSARQRLKSAISKGGLRLRKGEFLCDDTVAHAQAIAEWQFGAACRLCFPDHAAQFRG